MSHPAIDRHTIERLCQDPAALRPSFQPIVDLERRSTWGYEVFAGVKGPFDAPTELWFAAASHYGLAGALEARIVRTALTGRGEIPAERRVAVNVTPGALASAQLQTVVRGQDLQGIVLEVRESDVAQPGLDAALEPYRAAGAALAVDAVGGGFTDLRRTAELRPDLLKLDPSLVAGIGADGARAAAAEAIAALARRLGGTAGAVGVERREDLDPLRELGVQLVQGFIFGPREDTLAAAERRWGAAAG